MMITYLTLLIIVWYTEEVGWDYRGMNYVEFILKKKIYPQILKLFNILKKWGVTPWEVRIDPSE